jgi:hypothetical protein
MTEPGALLDLVREEATQLVEGGAAPAVRVRLLREVLGAEPEQSGLLQARCALSGSSAVASLESEQAPDGGWGRFHSADSLARRAIPTTEVGVERAVALGLSKSDPLLARAARYVADILDGRVPFPDPPEKNERWTTGARLFAAATLSQIDASCSSLDESWRTWMSITCRTFAAGHHDAQAEAEAHRELTGVTGELSYLGLCGKYQLALLGARADDIPRDVSTALLRWVWESRDGIRYLGQPVSSPPTAATPRCVEAWFASLELLSRFQGCLDFAVPAVEWLWRRRGADSYWDFGPRSATSRVLPFSESWRRRSNRRTEWTARVLLLIARFCGARAQ